MLIGDLRDEEKGALKKRESNLIICRIKNHLVT